MTVVQWLETYVGPYTPSTVVYDGLTLVGPDWRFVSAVALLCVLIVCVFRLAWCFLGVRR